MNVKKKRMVAAHGAGKELAKMFGVSEQTISLALNFKTNSLVAIDIRKAAKEEFEGKIIRQ